MLAVVRQLRPKRKPHRFSEVELQLGSKPLAGGPKTDTALIIHKSDDASFLSMTISSLAYSQ